MTRAVTRALAGDAIGPAPESRRVLLNQALPLLLRVQDVDGPARRGGGA